MVTPGSLQVPTIQQMTKGKSLITTGASTEQTLRPALHDKILKWTKGPLRSVRKLHGGLTPTCAQEMLGPALSIPSSQKSQSARCTACPRKEGLWVTTHYSYLEESRGRAFTITGFHTEWRGWALQGPGTLSTALTISEGPGEDLGSTLSQGAGCYVGKHISTDAPKNSWQRGRKGENQREGSPAPDKSGVFPLPRGRSLHGCLQTQPREPLLETPPYPPPSVLPLLGRASEWVWGKEKRGSVSHRGCRASLHHTQHGTRGQEPGAIPSGSRRPSHQGRYVPVTLMETLQLEKKQQC